MKVRYIKEFINGSNTNAGCHWVEIQAIDYYGINRALNKTVTASTTPSTSYEPVSAITDNVISESGYVYFPNSDKAGITVNIDLGDVYSIDEIKVWHYYVGGRQYKDMLLQVSQDNSSWTTIWDGAVSGVYAETDEGKTHKLAPEMSMVKPTVTSSLSDIVDYYSYFVNKVKEQKEALVEKLNLSGIEANEEETMTDIIKKISEINISPLPSWYKLSNVWIAAANMKTGRCRGMYGLVNGKFYVLRGQDGDHANIVCSYYDVKTNKWTAMADASSPLTDLVSVCVNGKIYGMCGINSSSTYAMTQCYIPETNEWVKYPTVPNSRMSAGAVAVGTKIYVLGGYYVRPIDILDTETGTWTTKGTMYSENVYGFAVASLGNNIYVFGDYSNYRQLTYMYDTVANSWTQKTNIPDMVTYADAITFNNKMHVLGGAYNSTYNRVYDPVTNTWTNKQSMSTGRMYSMSFIYDNKIYAVGGGNSSGTPHSSVEVYIP